jgi:type III restriction enzyme
LITDSISCVERTAKERNNKFVETLTYKLAESSMKDEVSFDELKSKDAFGKMTLKLKIVLYRFILRCNMT